MYTLRDRPVLALVSDPLQRESVIWCAWVIASAGHGRLQVMSADAFGTGHGFRGPADCPPHIASPTQRCLATAIRLGEVESPALVVTDWDEQSRFQDVLRFAAVHDAAAVLVRWPSERSVDRVLISSGGGENSLRQIWIAREIAARCGSPAAVLHVVSGESLGADCGRNLDGAVTDLQARSLGLPGPVDIVLADDVVSGIVSHACRDDLIVVGAPNHYRMPEHFRGSIPELLARRLSNPVMVFLGRRSGRPRLRDVFWPQMIRLGLDAGTKEEAIGLLVDTLIRQHQVPGAWADRLLDIALARERVMSTGVGCETAFPHITVPDCAGVAGVLGVFPQGVDFADGTGQRTRFVFLLLTAADHYDEYLAVLSGISQRMVRPDVRSELLSCATPAAVLGVLDPGGAEAATAAEEEGTPPVFLSQSGKRE